MVEKNRFLPSEDRLQTITSFMKHDSLYKDLTSEDLYTSHVSNVSVKVPGYAHFSFKNINDLLAGYKHYSTFQLRRLRSGAFFITNVATASLVANSEDFNPQSVVYCLLEDITSHDPSTEEEDRVTTLKVAKIEPSGSTTTTYISAMRSVTLYEPTRKEALPFVGYLC